MIQFNPVKLSDKSLLQPFLYENQEFLCNWSFPNMILWSETYRPHYTFINNMLVGLTMKDNNPVYGFPIGKGDIKPVMESLMAHAEVNNHPFKMAFLTEEMKQTVENLYPNQFEFEEKRDAFDYIYNVNDLLYLTGKKYQPKRNHINQFKKNYSYIYSPLNASDISDCLEMQKLWCIENECYIKENCMLKMENCAVEKALTLFDKMDMKGGVLRVDNKVIAFTIGQALNNYVFEVNIEKALRDYHGAYPMINQQFVEHEMQGYQYVNREEDVNDDGIRKAKLSYHPVILLKKYIATKL